MYLTRAQAVRIVKPLMTRNQFDGIVKKFNFNPVKIGKSVLFTDNQIFTIMLAYYLHRKIGFDELITKVALRELSDQAPNYEKIIMQFPYEKELKDRVFKLYSDEFKEVWGRRLIEDNEGKLFWLIIDPSEVDNIHSIFQEHFETYNVCSFKKVGNTFKEIFDEGLKQEDPISDLNISTKSNN